MQALWEAERLHLWKLFSSTATTRVESGSRHHQHFHSKHVAIITELTSTAPFFCRQLENGRKITLFCCKHITKRVEEEKKDEREWLERTRTIIYNFFRLLLHSPFFCLNVQLFIAPKWKLTTSALFFCNKIKWMWTISAAIGSSKLQFLELLCLLGVQKNFMMT